MFKKILKVLKTSDEVELEEFDRETAVAPKPDTASQLNQAERQNRELGIILGEKTNELWLQMSEVIQEIELRELMLDLDVSPTEISGTGSKRVYMEFVSYLKRRQRIPELLTELESRWPTVNWQVADMLQAISNFNNSRLENAHSEKTAPLPQTDWRDMLNQTLNNAELATLAFDLSIDYDILSGDNKSEKIDSLLLFLESSQRLDELAVYMAKARPNFAQTANKTGQLANSQNYQQALNELSLFELTSLCERLGLDIEDFPGTTKSTKIMNLFAYLERKQRLDELYPALKNLSASEKSENYIEKYDTHRIRTLIFQVFPDDTAMTDFCRKYLPEVIYEFGSSMSYRHKVQAMLEYCTRKKQFELLLTALETTFPEAFLANGPYLQENPQSHSIPEPLQGKFLLTDEWIDRAKREGRE